MGASRSDTTEYPRDHTFFCFVQDDEADAPPFVAEIAEDVAETGPVTINEILSMILRSVNKKLVSERTKRLQTQDDSDDDDIDGSEDGYVDYDDHFEAAISSLVLNQDSKIQTKYLQR